MTDQPYQGHQPHRPHQPHQPYEGHEGYDAQVWPGQHQQGEHTQQWQGQTWETQLQPPVPAEETAYLPPQTDGAYGGGYGGHPYGSQQHQPQPQQYRQQPPQPQPEPQQYQQPLQQQYEPQAQQQYQQPAQQYQPYAPQAQAQPQPYAPQSPAAPEPPAATAATAATAAPAATDAADAPEYGPATLAGNARITDAQRARAEGRSPIIDPGMQPAALTALLGLLLAGAAAVGTYALLVPLVVLQAVTAAGWFRLNGMWPARQGIALGFAGALAADAAMLASDRSPAALLGTLGVWVLLSLVLQLRSHADPDERMYGLTATVAAAALAVVAGGYLAADADAVTVGAVAVAVAVVARALPLPTPASVVVALLAAAGAGIAVGAATGLGTSGALLGAGAAVCALIGHRVAAYDYPSRFVHFTAGVALPLAASAPAVYLLGRALG
ncbi:hypothetical protein AB0D84_10680 [Streptomyces sp. NPDC048193]|uniref:hypothetical protein n=1 Tax=unclassified Streptomyces TaxID=2593676 RepID=UPI00342DF6F8